MSKRYVRSLIAVCSSVVLGAAWRSSVASPEGSSSEGSSSTGATALNTELHAPEDMAFDADGNLYVSEFDGDVVDRIDPSGVLTVVAGTGVRGFSGEGGPATQAMLQM